MIEITLMEELKNLDRLREVERRSKNRHGTMDYGRTSLGAQQEEMTKEDRKKSLVQKIYKN